MHGFQALKEVIRYCGEVPVILDQKIGDIASTATAYSEAAFTMLRVGAVTINPFMGFDAVSPFLAHPRKSIFALAKTSNASSEDFQMLTTLNNGAPLYESVVTTALKWGAQNQIGFVVGATDPTAVQRVASWHPGAGFCHQEWATNEANWRRWYRKDCATITRQGY